MAAVEMKDKKKEMIEKTAQEFQKLNGDNQMFILGYMLGIQQERQRTTPQPQTAFNTHIRKTPKMKPSTFERLPIILYSPRCGASADYKALVEEWLRM